MSAPELRQRDNGVWYIHWTEGRRSRRCSTNKKSLVEAQTYFAHWLLTGKEVSSSDACAFTVRELWRAYYDRHVRLHNVVENADGNWKNLEPHFGDLTPAEVTDDVVEDYVEKREEGEIGRPSGSSTIRRELAILRAMFNWCASKRGKNLLKPTEVPSYDLPAEAEARDRWLSIDEITKLFDAAAAMRGLARLEGGRLSRGERFLWIALQCAARKTAIRELTWDRVDFETRMIEFNVPGRKKTKKRRAAVPISDDLLPVLLRAYEERVSEYVLDHPGDGMWKTVKAVSGRAGIGGVSPHVMRHTAATHMARRGVPLWRIAGVLGNTLVMVEKVYAKHCPEALAEAVGTITGGKLKGVA